MSSRLVLCHDIARPRVPRTRKAPGGLGLGPGAAGGGVSVRGPRAHPSLVAQRIAGTGITSWGISAGSLVTALVTVKPHSSSQRR